MSKKVDIQAALEMARAAAARAALGGAGGQGSGRVTTQTTGQPSRGLNLQQAAADAQRRAALITHQRLQSGQTAVSSAGSAGSAASSASGARTHAALEMSVEDLKKSLHQGKSQQQQHAQQQHAQQKRSRHDDTPAEPKSIAKRTKADAREAEKRQAMDTKPAIVNPYLDDSTAGSISSRRRAPRQFAFATPAASSIVSKVADESISEQEAIADAAPSETDVPIAEWWDVLLLPNGTYDDLIGKDGVVSMNDDANNVPSDAPFAPALQGDGTDFQSFAISRAVFTPPPPRLQSSSGLNANKAQELKLYLTKDERARLRRNRRAAEQKEQRDRIKLGLEAPEPPRVRPSTLVRAMGDKMLTNPTKTAMDIQAQIDARQKKHEEANAARQLTKEQRYEKEVKKRELDAEKQLMAAVYRVKNLDKSKLYQSKVLSSAKERGLTGIALVNKDMQLVVVEGGAGAQREFRRVMLRRIDWKRPPPPRNASQSGDTVDTGIDNAGDSGNGSSLANWIDKASHCALVWHGAVPHRSELGDFKIKNCATASYARSILERASVAHYWDAAAQFDPAIAVVTSQDCISPE